MHEQTRSDVESFLFPWRRLKVQQEEWTDSHRRSPPEHISFADVEREIEEQVASGSSPDDWFSGWIRTLLSFSWGEKASRGDIRAAAEKLSNLDVGDRPRLSRYLRIFQKRTYPLDISPFAENRRSSCRCGRRTHEKYDPQVVTGWGSPRSGTSRTLRYARLAFELRERFDWWRSSWVGLLRNNYEHGDHRFIEESARAESDKDIVHQLCIVQSTLLGYVENY